MKTDGALTILTDRLTSFRICVYLCVFVLLLSAFGRAFIEKHPNSLSGAFSLP